MTCTVRDCSMRAHARGLCDKHYKRFQKHGDPETVAYVRLPAGSTPAERFWAKVEKTDTCWLWHGGKTTHGYGSFQAAGRGTTTQAYRFAYELLVGPIPPGLALDHLCRVPACVNPAHLEPVTRGENSLRGLSPNVVAHHQGTCTKGHHLDEGNLYIEPGSGRRRCRICRKAKETPCRTGHRSEERHHTAARDYRCDWCGKSIPKGSEYVVATEFPGGEAGYADAAGRPVHLRIHAEAPCHHHEVTA